MKNIEDIITELKDSKSQNDKMRKHRPTDIDEAALNLDSEFDEDIIPFKEKELYPKTREPFTLNEICYVMTKLMEECPVEIIADFTGRAPWLIRHKFIEYRPLNPDGSLIFHETVETLEEAMTYSNKEVEENL